MLWTIVIAFSFFLLSYLFIFQSVTNQNILTATIWNSAAIIFFLILGKIELPAARKKKAKKREYPRILQLFHEVTASVSIKAALYFFYIVLLMCTAIIAVEPDFPILHNLGDYFRSVYYGLLVLIATDKFLEQMFKDENSIEVESISKEQKEQK